MVVLVPKCFLEPYHIDNVACGRYVEKLHDAVVKTIVGRKQVKITANENSQE
jgi:hypothetical protein